MILRHSQFAQQVSEGIDIGDDDDSEEEEEDEEKAQVKPVEPYDLAGRLKTFTPAARQATLQLMANISTELACEPSPEGHTAENVHTAARIREGLRAILADATEALQASLAQ